MRHSEKMTATPEHITFRPGELVEKLTRGPLSPGATAKQDLIRYYVMVSTKFDEWQKGTGITWDAWDVLMAFVSTRSWEAIPYPVVFQDQFASFLKSPMAKEFERTAKGLAFSALVSADYAEVIAIVHHAELGLSLSLLGEATADPTSAALAAAPG